jgi:hypothetical protein
MLLVVFVIASFTSNDLNQDIIGTWVSEDDSNWKIEFTTNGKCYWYYTGDSTEIYTYTITDFSNSLSQTAEFCGKTVSARKKQSYYLKLVGGESNDSLCYEIFGITETSLSINSLGKSKIIVFDKQK